MHLDYGEGKGGGEGVHVKANRRVANIGQVANKLWRLWNLERK